MTRRSLIYVLLALFTLAALGQAIPRSANKPAATEDGIDIFFSPRGGCTDAIVAEINDAKKSIHVQAYSFTSAPIAQALMEAHKRGVPIVVVLDSSQKTAQYSSATFLLNQGIPVFIDFTHAIAHNKIVLIDEATIVTGSFNFSKNAEESNAENLLIIRDKPNLYKAYEQNFQSHLTHSIKYDASGADKPSPHTAPASTSPAAATTSPESADVLVHVTRSGKKYHREGCRFLSKSDQTISLKDAKSKGYMPCSSCSPAQ